MRRQSGRHLASLFDTRFMLYRSLEHLPLRCLFKAEVYATAVPHSMNKHHTQAVGNKFCCYDILPQFYHSDFTYTRCFMLSCRLSWYLFIAPETTILI